MVLDLYSLKPLTKKVITFFIYQESQHMMKEFGFQLNVKAS